MKSKLSIISLFTSAVIASASWVQTNSGTYNYDDLSNWEDEVIDGVFDYQYTGKPWFTIKMMTNSVYNLDLRFGGETKFYFQSGSGEDLTFLLDKDMDINTTNWKSNIYFGSSVEGNGLNFDLGGGTRSINNNNGSGLFFRNKIFNGNLVLKKGTTTLDTANGVIDQGSSVTVYADATLGIGVQDDIYEVVNRADTVNLDSGCIYFIGHNKAPASTDVIDTLVLASNYDSQKVPKISTQSKYNNAVLQVNNLIRKDNACLVITYNNVDFGRTNDLWTCLLKVASPTIETIGGERGTASTPIVPWVRGNDDSIMFTYDENYGFMPLSNEDYRIISEPFQGSISEYSGENIRLANGAGVLDILDEDVTINSLSGSTSSEWVYATNGVLRIASGSITLNQETRFNGNLDLGPNTGYIWYRAGKVEEMFGTISGNDIVIQPFFYQHNKTLTISSKGLFTGDLYLNGAIWACSRDFLPFGERKGRTIVNGALRFGTPGDFYINGLEGTGTVSLENSFKNTFYVGDNNASGVFDGKIRRNNGTLAVNKIGTGTQVVNGEFFINQPLTIEAGAFITNDRVSAQNIRVKNGATYGGAANIDNADTSIFVEENATIKPGDSDGVGTMSVAGNITMADTSKLAFTFTSTEEVSSMAVAGNVLGADANVDVTLDGDLRAGNYLLLSGASLEPNFVSNTPNVLLRKENGGTELWAYVPQEATLIVIR